MKVYVSGPMRGRDDFNFPEFDAAAARFRAAGFEVFNPAESFGRDTGLYPDEYLRLDVLVLAGCHAIAMLRGWQASVGARLERAIAQHLEMAILCPYTLRRLDDNVKLVIRSVPV